MKKVLLLTLVLSMLVSCFAVAAPSVDYIFSVTENGNVYYYMFGRTETTTTDVGVSINGKDYNLDENALTKAQKSGRFGIGIADPDNILGESFSATPYEVVNGEKQTGEEKSIVKTNVADNDVIALNSLTINGKAVAGFYTGTTETDFYYGLDEITSAESIPQVSYSLSTGTAETSLTEEKGGYVYTISTQREGRDGETKTAEFKVHFREFAEKTVSVKPTIAYRQHYSYMDTTSDFLDLKNATGKTFSTNTADDVTSTQNTYLYFAYEVEQVSGYAPVSFDLVGLKARYNPLDIYVYDGDLSDVTLPETIEETDKNKYMFAGNKGLNTSTAFHFTEFGTASDTPTTQTGTVASSTAVSDGNNILIVKSQYPQTGSYPAYIIYGDWASCYMTMNVKYVEKNPKDATDVDTTLSTLTINGKKADAVKDDTYYVAVSDIETNDGITKDMIVATPTYADGGATAVVSEIENNQATVTVTAKDGETTKNYTVKFKQMTSTVLPFKSKQTNSNVCEILLLSNGAYSATTVSGNNMYASYQSRVLYFDYSTTGLAENSKIVGTANISGTAERYSDYTFYNSSYTTIDSNCTYAEFDEGGNANLLGSHVYASGGSSNISITFEASNLDIKEGGYIKIAMVDGNNNEGITRLTDRIPTLTINYITLD